MSIVTNGKGCFDTNACFIVRPAETIVWDLVKQFDRTEIRQSESGNLLVTPLN